MRASRGRRLSELGHEPDYRFSLANERTFLAWIRTALALDASGVGVIQLFPASVVPGLREAIALVLVGLGTLVAMTSYRRWAAYERAIRTDEPLPPSRLPPLLASAVAVVSIVAVVLLLLAEPWW